MGFYPTAWKVTFWLTLYFILAVAEQNVKGVLKAEARCWENGLRAGAWIFYGVFVAVGVSVTVTAGVEVGCGVIRLIGTTNVQPG